MGVLLASLLGAASARADEPPAEEEGAEEERKPKLLLTTTVFGLDLAHAFATGQGGTGTSFGVRYDSDFRFRRGLLDGRMNLDLAIGGGSRLTGSAGAAALVGVGVPLSPGKYLFARAGTEAFYRQRPRGMLSVIEAPKGEIGFGAAPIALEGSKVVKKMALEVSLSAGLAAGAWAADGDPSLGRAVQYVAPSFGAGIDWTVVGGSFRAELLHVRGPSPMTRARFRPCFAALFVALCLDTEVVHASFPRASGELVGRTGVSLGALLGMGIAWFEPQVPNEARRR